MIPLHPKPLASHACPGCGAPLDVLGWYMPGMRTLAELRCPACRGEYFADLPSGFGLLYPCLLDKRTGEVHDPNNAPWHAAQLKQSYRGRTDSPVGFEVESFKPVRRPLVLNALDVFYGHAVQKLLNAQHELDRQPEWDLVIVVPRYLRWMVPDGAAEVWTVDLPLKRGAEWNDWLAAEFRRRIGSAAEAALSLGFICPHPADFDIERFTGIRPFDQQDWVSGRCRPVVTFIWRDDRTWPDPGSMRHVGWFAAKAGLRLKATKQLTRSAIAAAQRRQVVRLASLLRRTYPQLDFAVAGPARPGGLPQWIEDLRCASITAEQEREWCRRYARSHMVIGIHGSNLVLPSAHAGSVIELVPPDRWGALGTTVYPPSTDPKPVTYRYLFIPAAIGPRELAHVAATMLRYLPQADLYFSREATDHEALSQDPYRLARRWRELSQACVASESTTERVRARIRP
jgi:hypothetical protein